MQNNDFDLVSAPYWLELLQTVRRCVYEMQMIKLEIGRFEMAFRLVRRVGSWTNYALCKIVGALTVGNRQKFVVPGIPLPVGKVV